MAAEETEVEVGDRLVRITNPGRVYFPARGETKLDLVRYYLSVGDGIVGALRAAVAADRAAGLPALQPARRRAVRDRAGRGGVGGADVHRRVSPVELPA